MKPTEASLLESIARDPLDRGARIVLGDYYAERGDPRGELIQLELAPVRTPEIAARIVEIVEEFADQWVGRYRKIARGLRWGLVGGLVGSVKGPPEVIAKHSNEIVKHAPLVHTIIATCSEGSDLLDGFAECSLVARALAVRVVGKARLRTYGLERIAKAPELRELVLERVGIDRDVMAALVAPPKLERLSLTACWTWRDCLEQLARARCTLRTFEAPGLRQGQRIAWAIGASPRMHELATLSIPRNGFGSDGLETLLPALAHVESLDIAANDIHVTALPALLAEGVAPKLRELSLANNPIGDEGAAMLARWPGAARLTSLDLSNTNMSNKGAAALAASPYLSPAATKLRPHGQKPRGIAT